MKACFSLKEIHASDYCDRFTVNHILMAVPTGYEDALIYQGTGERAVGEVVGVDNSAIKAQGLYSPGSNRAHCLLKTGCLPDRN